jgi:hypothetical protein
MQRTIQDLKETVHKLQQQITQLELESEDNTSPRFATGDQVVLLSSGVLGKKGDRAKVLKVRANRVTIRLARSGITTHRLSKNLRLDECQY